MATTSELFKGLTPIQVLQEVDKVLKHFQGWREIGGLSFDQIANYFDPEHKTAFSYSLTSILEKLIRDEKIFIQKDSNNTERYCITIEGKIFEGYEKQRMNEDNEREYKFNYNKRMEDNSVLLSRASIALAILTGLLVIVGILDLIKALHSRP